jgi:hypothetical protein
MDPTDLQNYAAAIRSIESSGNYGATGPATRNGDHAYGAYQVMGNNIPGWTQKHYGQALSPQQFLNNKQAQDAVFNGQFGGYVQQHGNPQDAASMWFSGRPMAGNNSNDGSIAVPEYVRRFNKAMGQGGGALALAGDDGAKAPALAAIDQAAGPGTGTSGSGVLYPGEGPNKLDTIGSTLANVGSAIAGISNPGQASSLHSIAQGIEAKAAGGNYQYQMGPNGQLVRIDKRSGKVDSMAIPGSQKESFKPIMGKDDNGNPTLQGTFNESTGEYKPAGGGSAAGAQGPTIGGDPNLTGKERYDSLSPADQRQIDAWFNGTGIQPSQYSMRNNPKMQKLMDAASAVYGPEMDFQKYGERQQFVRGYANKAPSAYGGQLVSIEHTADLVRQQAERYTKLGNSSGAIGGYGATGSNMFKNATGGNERANTIDQLKGGAETLSGEYQTMITRGKGGGQAERADYAGNVNKPTAAPEVQAAGLQTMIDGLRARHKEIVEAARSAGGQAWLDKHPDVDTKIQETIDKAQKQIDALHGLNKPGAKAETTFDQRFGAAPSTSSWADAQKAGWK